MRAADTHLIRTNVVEQNMFLARIMEYVCCILEDSHITGIHNP